jgi:hypothetical protein
MRKRLVWVKPGIVGNMHHIGTIGKKIVFTPIQLCPDNYCFKFAIQPVCQFASLGQQFEAYFSHNPIIGFAIYKYAVHIYLVFVQVIQWCG